jgi:Protein of unknown function (DUF2442)
MPTDLFETEFSIAVFCSRKGGDMPKPTDVKPLPNHRIWLRYDDGTEGEVDLSDLAGQGVFEPWNDPAFFNTVHLGSHGAIEWSPDLDLCPDAMYIRLTGKSVAEVFPDIRLVSTDA